MSSIQYRPDIDGLRAIAVLAVLLYHYGIGGLRGGFVGVDVFFVISGYLIARIIQAEIQRGVFTLASFYERRARRIFPALFVVLLVTILLGLFLLLPSDLLRLGRATLATVLFVSNVQYMLESGYFAGSSDFNVLLHTWSLGVEEQFYLGLPMLLLLVHRFAAKHLGIILAACAFLSLALCVVLQPKIPSAAFFLSPFRAWEFLLGALLGVGVAPAIASPLLRELLAAFALTALLGSIVFMAPGVDFPGWKAMVPVLATAVLLHSGQAAGTHCSRLLSLRPLVYVGLISYSLYLWHWPILVFARYDQGMEPLSFSYAVVMAALAVLLSAASYRFIERPLRYWRKSDGEAARGKVFGLSALTAVVLLVAGGGLVFLRGLPSRVPSEVLALDQARTPAIPYVQCDDKPVSIYHDECHIGAGGSSDLTLVWGDSWAMAWAPALDEVLKREGRSGVLALRSACAPLLGVRNLKSPSCLQRNEEILAWIKLNRPVRVVMVAAWPMWTETRGGYPLVDASGEADNRRIFARSYSNTLDALKPYVKEIVVIGPTPGGADYLPYRMAMLRWHDAEAPRDVSRLEFDAASANFWKLVRKPIAGVRIIDPAPWFCDQMRCRQIDSKGSLLYRDGQHLSLAGAEYVATWLQKLEVLAANDDVRKHVLATFDTGREQPQ